ncbi:aldo/keto reductase [Steroidobacter sp. S1-65]|uniref:Aldo/keto reductase n=1 Tax=Steroidobacter gossypii TaxID=2805490 RepID=A0ABS1X0V3_9GAMM|nr:aldo/keto reductase [Steroidobacter gossypii]MBM0106868.1 aldo/keto reductase [Steroidobacter gossypii]
MSEIGLGAAPLGNLYQPISEADAQATLASALAADVTYVDCAPYYGFGLCERRVGDALRGRDDVVISTKVGRVLVAAPEVVDDRERHGFRSSMPFSPIFDYSYDGVMRSWEASLQRLGLARINVLYVHDIGSITHGDAHQQRMMELTKRGGLRALEVLRSEGQIDGFGLGVNEIDVCLTLLREADLDVILLAGRYTLLEQGAMDELMPECARRGVSLVIGGPYNSGILATGTRGAHTPRFNYEHAPDDVIQKVRRLEDVCERHRVALPAAALQFALAHPQVASVIPGLCGPAQVEQTLELYRARIPDAFWNELKSQRLIRDNAPVPESKSS